MTTSTHNTHSDKLARKAWCIELLQKLITYETITPKECGIYDEIVAVLEPLGFCIMRFDKGDTSNLFAYITPLKDSQADSSVPCANLDSSAITSKLESSIHTHALSHTHAQSSTQAHFCFMGHIDVVPVGEGWSVGAFSGEERDGYIYGRGAQDMKAGVAAFVCAMADFIAATLDSTMQKDSAAQDRTHTSHDSVDSLSLDSASCDTGIASARNAIFSILLTSDEEGSGIYGTRYVLEQLEAHKLLPTHAIVAEPTCSHAIGDTIKHGRRGSINGTLEIKGKQGHAAYPSKCINPIEALGSYLGKIAGVELDSGTADFAPSKLVITDMRGGLEAVNVTPSSLRIMFNVRNSPLSSKESLRAYLMGVVDEIAQMSGISCELHLQESAKPFLCEKNAPFVTLLHKSIESICAITPTYSTSGGTSDARFSQEFGIQAVEFGVCNDRIHAIDERVKITEVEKLYLVFSAFLRAFNENVRGFYTPHI